MLSNGFDVSSKELRHLTAAEPHFLVRRIHFYRQRDHAVARLEQNLVVALETWGFAVRRVPLYREGMELRCLDQLSDKARQWLVSCWGQKSSLVVTIV